MHKYTQCVFFIYNVANFVPTFYISISNFYQFFYIKRVHSIHQKFPFLFIANIMPKQEIIFIHNFAYFRLKNYKKSANRKIELHF